MGQNQTRVGEQQGTLEEKDPSPDPGGSEKEGNASEVTCGEVEDEAGLVRERLDLSPGTEPASPTLKLDTHSHKKGAPPIDWEWIQGGDGEREGGRERGEGEGGRTEVRGLQKLNNIRVTKRDTLSREVAGSSKPECKAVAERSNRMDLENSANDSHEWNVIHKDNIQHLACDSSSGVENVHFQQSKSSITAEKSVTSEDTGSLKNQDGGSTTDIVDVPGIDTLMITEDFLDNNFPFELSNLKSEAPTRTKEKINLDTSNAPLQKNLREENPVWQDGPAAIAKSYGTSLAEEDRGRVLLCTSSRDNLPLQRRSTKPECQDKIISRDLSSSGVQDHAATSEQIYGTEIPSLAMTFDLSDRSELTTTGCICPLNSKDVWDFTTTVEHKTKDKFGKIKKHQAAGNNIESGDTTGKNTTNPDSSKMASLGFENDKAPTMSGFEELPEEEKHLSMPNLLRLKNNAERKTDVSCDAGGEIKETEEFPFEREGRVDYYPPAETDNVQTEKIPEQFLAVVTGQSEMLMLPDMTKSIMGKMDPHLALHATMESKDALVREKEIRNQDMFLVKTTASESDWEEISDSDVASVKNSEERSTTMLEKDRYKSFGEVTSSKDRDNQSVHKNLTSVTDIHQEASASISNSKLIADSESSTTGYEEGRPLLSYVESKISKCVESHELKNMTQLCIEDHIKPFTGPAKDGCGGSVSQNPGTDDAATPLDVQNPLQVSCLQHNTGKYNLTPQFIGQSLTSDHDTTMLSQTDQSIGISNDQTPVSAPGGVSAREKAETPSKGKPVSDLIKETIQLHEKMKEWTKPAEAKPDVVLDSAQSVKVAQMKAAFDSPKRSLAKGLEKKPSVRKGKTQLLGAYASRNHGNV